MRKLLSVSGIAVVFLACTTALTASADDGCNRALTATVGTPGHAFVAAHCTSPSIPAEVPAVSAPSSLASGQAGVQGCAFGLASAAGTPGEPFVRAACNRLADQVGVPIPPPISPPTSDQGCAIAELMTRGTAGHPWVVANCVQTGDGAAAGAQSAAAGCELAIQAVVNTIAEPFVRAGCAQATAGSAVATAANDDTGAVDAERSVDSDQGN